MTAEKTRTDRGLRPRAVPFGARTDEGTKFVPHSRIAGPWTIVEDDK